jgi:hypothetical protein
LFYSFNSDLKKWWTIDLEVTVAKMCNDPKLIRGNSQNGIVTGKDLMSWCERNMKDELGSAIPSKYQSPVTPAVHLMRRLIRAKYLAPLNEDGTVNEESTFQGDSGRYGFTLLAQQVHDAATNKFVMAAAAGAAQQNGNYNKTTGDAGKLISPEEVALKIQQMKKLEQQLMMQMKNLQQQQNK